METIAFRVRVSHARTNLIVKCVSLQKRGLTGDHEQPAYHKCFKQSTLSISVTFAFN